MKTKTQPKQNGKPTPKRVNELKKPRRVKKTKPTASEIADAFEAEAKRLRGLADILIRETERRQHLANILRGEA